MERLKSNGGEHNNLAYDATLDEPPHYEENNGEHRTVRPSVVSAFGHDTLDRVPNIDFYRNAGSVSGHRAVRPSLQELHDVFQKVSDTDYLHLFLFSRSASLPFTSPSAETISHLFFSPSPKFKPLTL